MQDEKTLIEGTETLKYFVKTGALKTNTLEKTAKAGRGDHEEAQGVFRINRQEAYGETGHRLRGLVSVGSNEFRFLGKSQGIETPDCAGFP